MKTNFLILFFSFLFVCTSIHAEDCIELTNKILRGSVLKNSPDDKAVFHINSNTADETFQNAKINFLKIIEKTNEDGNRLVDILEDLKKKDNIKDLKHSKKNKEELLEELKGIRKQAIILRSVFEIYSTTHMSPEQFEKFTKKLGKLNDFLDFDAWKAIPDGAKSTAKAFDLETIKKELNGFTASTPEATQLHLERLKKEIYQLVNKENLTVDEFHETRKHLKHFLAITQIENKKEGSNLDETFKFLEEMNEELGSLRDDVLEVEVKAINKGKKLDDEDYQHIPENLKSEIRVFLKGFKIQID